MMTFFLNVSLGRGGKNTNNKGRNKADECKGERKMCLASDLSKLGETGLTHSGIIHLC